MFNITPKSLGKYDILVCGGGVAGVAAAVSAARQGARVLLVESSGCLGGTMTMGLMCYLIDGANKGGIVKELLDFMVAHDMSTPRRGKKVDENGKRIPGFIVDTEAAKYFFDRLCADAGVKVLLHSRIAAIDHTDGHVNEVLIACESGNYSATADLYIDASGNGALADMAGCEWECGDPAEGRPSPASTSICVGGMPEDYDGTDTFDDKTAYNDMLESHGIHISAQQACLLKLPSLMSWDMSVNFEYDVMPDNIESLTRAEIHARKEIFETIQAHKKIEGCEKMHTLYTAPHIGTREGRRIFGEYRITDDDILEGKRFDDAICLVTAGVDVHKLNSNDTTECARGFRSKPYNIPYRCLVPKASDNMLLAGRCISGDFYPFSSYRMMGNMMAVGEACGFAAANCVKEGISPRDFDGRRAKEFMAERGFAL